MADRQQLLVALGSLSSSVEQYMSHSANCVKCKTNKEQDLIELLADSSASLNFTHEQSDLSEFQEVHDDDFNVQTAAKSPPLTVKGVGCMFLMTSATSGTRSKKIICLYLSSTVAQKTAPMFAYYVKTHVLLDADII